MFKCISDCGLSTGKSDLFAFLWNYACCSVLVELDRECRSKIDDLCEGNHLSIRLYALDRSGSRFSRIRSIAKRF